MFERLNENTWHFEEPDVRFFLLEGEKEAMLLDSGKITADAREQAQAVTKKPLFLLNTHADLDHVRSNYEFETFYMHPSEAFNYYKRFKGTGEFLPLHDGQIFDLGGRPLEVILLAGHTPGSVALLDINARTLFCGDVLGENYNIFLFGQHREIHAYLNSLKKLEGMMDRFDRIYPSHGVLEIGPGHIPVLREGVEKILRGEGSYVLTERYNTTVRRYDLGLAGLLCDNE